MIFWLFVIMFVVSFLLYCADDSIARSIVALFSLMLVALSLANIIDNHIKADAQEAEKQEEYKALVCKAESRACRDEFGLLNKEVFDEIQEWNQDIAYKKTIQRDFWLGIFYPNIYDQFELIDYEKYSKE